MKREELVAHSLDLSEEAQLKSDMNECIVILQSLILHRHCLEYGYHDSEIAINKCQEFDKVENPSQFFETLRRYLICEIEKYRDILMKYHDDYIEDRLQERTLGEIYG